MEQKDRREKAGPLRVVAVASAADVARFNALLDAEHYLGSRQPSSSLYRTKMRRRKGRSLVRDLYQNLRVLALNQLIFLRFLWFCVRL